MVGRDMTGQSCALLLVNNKQRENFKFTSWVFNQTFELRIKLVHKTTKYGLAPLEVGPEFPLNLGFVNSDQMYSTTYLRIRLGIRTTGA